MPFERLANDLAVAEHRAHVLKALGNPVRLRIAAQLADAKELSVGELCKALDLPQARVSQALGTLRLMGIVAPRREGNFHFYSLAMPHLEDLLFCLSRSCDVADSKIRQAR